ncbi:MAG TPA: DUF2442 domain-containing protein [Spirochaetota bacterium]|nr:DUF2442 domain-containing protein [Spirochaetota bacterium]
MKNSKLSPKITSITPNCDYTLTLKYGKEKRVFDMKPFLKIGLYKQLTDINVFKTAKISFDTIEWENGIDIDPEFLYTKSKSLATEAT